MEADEVLGLKGNHNGINWKIWAHPVLSWLVIMWPEGYSDLVGVIKEMGAEPEFSGEDVPVREQAKPINAIPAEPGTYKLEIFAETSKNAGWGEAIDCGYLIPSDLRGWTIEEFQKMIEHQIDEMVKKKQ